MERDAFISELKLRLTGDILELELDDSQLSKILDATMREIQRYITTTAIVTVPYESCIDCSKITDADGNTVKINSVTQVYRQKGYNGASDSSGITDPMYLSQWQVLSGTGNLYNFQDYVYNYLSWNTLLQIKNTLSTDLIFKYDKYANKLYINIATQAPTKVTIEFVPRYDSIEQITSDYWIDVIMQMAIATTKITLGRIRSRYTQSNALWTQDGQTILEEGLNDYRALQEYLRTNTFLGYPID